jgi:hypothetical protein
MAANVVPETVLITSLREIQRPYIHLPAWSTG